MPGGKWTEIETKERILDLNADGVPHKAIAVRVGKSRDTVRRRIDEYAREQRLKARANKSPAEMIQQVVELALRVKDELR